MRGRLEAAVDRARMIRDDVDLEPLGEWPVVPSADVEIASGIEWDPAGRVYQWGMRVRQGQDERTEAALASDFAARMGGVVTAAEAAGRSVAVTTGRTTSRVGPGGRGSDGPARWT